MQFRAFPGLVGLRILSFESVDYFGTNEQFSGRKKKILISETSMVRLNFHCM